MQLNRKLLIPSVVTIMAALMMGLSISYNVFSDSAPPSEPAKTDAKSSDSVELNETQLNAIKIEPMGTYHFALKKKAIGSVAYHEEDTVLNPAANRSTKIVVADVSESDSPLIHVKQLVEAKMAAYPDRVFDGKVSVLGGTVWDSGGNPAVDPNMHRIRVRCDIADPKNELYPGMLANIVIQVQEPVESVAVPANGIVRKGDGTMTVWVTTDRRHFGERSVKLGLEQDGYDQILDGLKPGELVATDGAVFLNNILYAPPSD